MGLEAWEETSLKSAQPAFATAQASHIYAGHASPSSAQPLPPLPPIPPEPSVPSVPPAPPAPPVPSVPPEPKPLVPQVIGVGLVFNADGKLLIDQRLAEGLLGGLWEFPGGKQEPGEAIVDTIRRELREELAIAVEVGEELIVLEHVYGPKCLRFVVHLCRLLSGEPQPLACQQLRWVLPGQLGNYPFPAANARIIAALLNHQKQLST